MKLSKWAELYLDELHGAHEYKELMEKFPEKTNYFKQMHDDEVKHANYIITMFPEVKEEIKNKYEKVKEEMEELEEIISMI